MSGLIRACGEFFAAQLSILVLFGALLKHTELVPAQICTSGLGEVTSGKGQGDMLGQHSASLNIAAASSSISACLSSFGQDRELSRMSDREHGKPFPNITQARRLN